MLDLLREATPAETERLVRVQRKIVPICPNRALKGTSRVIQQLGVFSPVIEFVDEIVPVIECSLIPAFSGFVGEFISWVVVVRADRVRYFIKENRDVGGSAGAA